MTFYQWLRKQKSRNDPVGDLARDAIRDRGINPSGTKPNSYKGWKMHLERCGACDGAIEALERAYLEYLDVQTCRNE